MIAPSPDCRLCPRLATFREEWRQAEPTWFNSPVPSFGDRQARLLVVGLAPGLRGANRTGRPFTGDYAGDLLYATLIAFGFARGDYDRRVDDGLELRDCMITNAVRCVPPQNKPLPVEIKTCRPFLDAVVEEMTRLQVMVALGRVAHESVLRAFEVKYSTAPFAHGATHELRRKDGAAVTLIDSYHCSRYNTNTGVLTEAMFGDVFAAVRKRLGGASCSA